MDKKYIKKISVDKPQRDDFSIENLINTFDNNKKSCFFNNNNNQANGFVAETFIRPPVNIFIEFVEPINLQSIYIDAKVNKQISNGFIISSSTSNSSLKQISKFFNEKNVNCHQYEFLRRNNKLDSPTDSLINRAFFGANPQTYLDKVYSINIAIVRTLNSSQPCLKSVKICGLLTNPIASSSNISDDSFKSTDKKSIPVPQEFLDELTHDLMRMPIKLPSNKVIDKTTLDKYLKELSNNKKDPQDPFTCIKFSAQYKPLIDEQLKSQIDRFLFDNNEFNLEKTNEATDMRVASVKRNYESCFSQSQHGSKKFNPNRQSPQKSHELRSDLHMLTCSCCLNMKSHLKNLYEIINCKHRFCRDCLKVLNNVCSVCNHKFNNSQIINIDRINLASMNKF